MRFSIVVAASAVAFLCAAADGQAASRLADKAPEAAVLEAEAAAGGAAVIVELAAPNLDETAPETSGDARSADVAREKVVAATVDGFVDRFFAGRNDRAATKKRALKTMRYAPLVAFIATPQELDRLAADPSVVAIHRDERLTLNLTESVPLIGMPEAWPHGARGAGTVVAVLDTGVQFNHPFFGDRVIGQACFSSGGTMDPDTMVGFCPNGEDFDMGSRSGANCPSVFEGCEHGTHVAGIVAGRNPNPDGLPPSGVAPLAKIFAVQVFSGTLDGYGTGAMTRDIIGALEYMYAQRNVLPGGETLAAINMSLGGGIYSSPCADSPYRPIIKLLQRAGVATVIANGNSFHPQAIGSPACVPEAIKVGSTTKTDFVSNFSDVAPFMDLFAPGSDILSSIPGNGYAVLSGTSMAAPTVAGAVAALRSAVPDASVDDILKALVDTGKPVTDRRLRGTVTKPRIQVAQALRALEARDSNLVASPSEAIVLPPGAEAVPRFAVKLSARRGAERWRLAAAPAWVTASVAQGRATKGGQKVRFTAAPLPVGTVERVGWLVFSAGPGVRSRLVEVVQRRMEPLIVTDASKAHPFVSTMVGGRAQPGRVSIDLWTTKGELAYRLLDVPTWVRASTVEGVATPQRASITFHVKPPRHVFEPIRARIRLVQANNGYEAGWISIRLEPGAEAGRLTAVVEPAE